MPPTTNFGPYPHHRTYPISNAAYEAKYSRQIVQAQKLLEGYPPCGQWGDEFPFTKDEYCDVVQACIRTLQAKVRLLEVLVPEAPMVYGKLLDKEYKYGDAATAGCDDAEVCWISINMLQKAVQVDEHENIFFNSDIWYTVQHEVIRILEKQAEVGAAEIFKRQLEEKLAADQAALERLMAK